MSIRTAPFARARAMFAAVAALAGVGAATRAEAIAALGPYESRGKGRAGYQASRRCVAQDKRDARKARNRKNHKRHL